MNTEQRSVCNHAYPCTSLRMFHMDRIWNQCPFFDGWWKREIVFVVQVQTRVNSALAESRDAARTVPLLPPPGMSRYPVFL